MEYSIESYPNNKCFQLDFGEVEVGATKIASIKIINKSNKYQSYVIQRDAISNPLDCVFHSVKCSWSLPPHESYVCDISYKPILPNRKYIDYFYITDTCHYCYKVITQGYCIGPKVTSSKTRLIMVCENKSLQTTKHIKLINHSNISAKFMFDVDNLQCPFKINKKSGIVKASSSKCFSISFEPKDIGIYKYYMPCLILSQNPIILELYGFCYYDLDKKCIESFYSKIECIDKLKVIDNFKYYMTDFMTVFENNPPSISLSWSILNFGETKIGLKNADKRSTQTVCLYNQNKYDIFVLWEKDISETFSIQPQKIKVEANQSIIFEVQFNPSDKNNTYSTDLIARIFCVPYGEKNFNISNEFLMNVIPDLISIRLIGQTFYNGSDKCLPQYEIPERVIMPACIPLLPVYTTFAITNFGLQSFIFYFVPPANSNYAVKPMMGLINHEKEHQLIIVQLLPGTEIGKAYVENWALRLNGNTNKNIYIEFHGYAEEVNLFIGSNSSVIFNPVHVGCEQTQLVAVRNPTRHRVRFEYLSCNTSKELQIQQINGTLDPNETTFHNFTFKPVELKSYEFDLRCLISSETGGKNSIVQIKVSGNSTESCLIAIPEELFLGKLTYKESYESEFNIFNFSSVSINYLLIWNLSENMQITKNTSVDLKFSPSQGTINPTKKEKVKIIVTPIQPGIHDIIIEYLTTSDLLLVDSISLLKSKTLCKLKYTCDLPILQIKDLLYEVETNKRISKFLLWKSLSIDNFNSALKNLLPLQEIGINMIVPVVPLDEREKFIIKLSLTNCTSVVASWYLKQKKTCLCNDRIMKNKFTVKHNFNTDCFYCIHDRSCTIQPKKLTLLKGETGSLTIIIKNKTLQSHGVYWDLNIGEDRHITLNIRLDVSIILSGPNLTFNNMFIGNCTRTYYQAIWLYNNSGYKNKYMIEMKDIIAINKKNYGIIFTCLNSRGTIEKYDSIPVFFGFRPNKFGKFKISINIKLGNQESTLNIEAESTCFSTKMFSAHEIYSFSDLFRTPEMIVHFNKHYISLPPLPTHGKIIKIFMVHNHHQQNSLYFEWKNYEIPEFVKINIEPSTGLIRPQSLITFYIEALIGYHECSLDVDLFCNFLDVSERRIIEKKKAQKENLIKKIENEFHITETGLIYSKNKILETIKKPTRFCKTLTIKINVYHSQSTDKIFNLLQQLKHTPTKQISKKMNSDEKNYSLDIINVSSQIFESLIWDIINSKYFTHILRNKLNTTHNVKYSQLPVNIVERKYQINRNNFTVPNRFIEDILNTMICMIVHEEFNLEIGHFSHPADVRQISYEKTYIEAYEKLTHFK